MFYDSNYDKYYTPKEPGWYVQFKTESGDEGSIKLPRKPLNSEDVMLMLEAINPDETWIVQFYKEVE